MRYFLRRGVPPVSRILLIESGSRELLENLIPGLRAAYGLHVPVDLVTCYSGLPKGFHAETTRVYRVPEYHGRDARRRLYRELAANGYSIVGMICSEEPIMTKWKWVLALLLRGKVFILNENGDYFWLDRAHWDAIRTFVIFRAGLADAGAVRTLARSFLIPLTVLYLLLYATTVHFRRALRRGYP